MDYSMKIVKEIYKSQVYCVKTRLLLTLHSKIGDKHGYSKSDKGKIVIDPAGVVLTTRDFGVEMRYQPALAKALNRLVHQGELQKIAKGKYYIPKKTILEI